MPSSKEETYLIKNKRLLIIDRELGLKIEAPFDPRLLSENPQWGQEVGDGYFISGNTTGSEFFVEKNGSLSGEWRLYYPSKKIKGEAFYHEGVLHGPSTYYTEDGEVLSRAWFVLGKQQGKSRWYYPCGRLYSLQRHKNGLCQGRQEYYYADGSLKAVILYKSGEVIDAQIYQNVCKQFS